MKFLFVFLFLIITLKRINCECTVYFDSDYPPTFIPEVDHQFLVFSSNSITFGQDNYLYAVCPSEFENLNYINGIGYREGTDTELVMKCGNKETKFLIDNQFISFTKILRCKSREKTEIFHKASTSGECKKNNYNINIRIGELSYVLADVCFDQSNNHIDFLHYVTKQNKIITHNHLRYKYNEELKLYSTKTEAPAEIFFIDEHTTVDLIKNIIGNETNFIQFKYEEFYPSNYWYPQIFEPLESAKTLNRFLGWRNFIEGNWRLFRNLLETRSEKVTYDVYIGTSGVVVAPAKDCSNTLKELRLTESYNKVATVPKYVWTYLKSREYDSEEFIIIGVNSPYFEFFPKKETIFCNDMCHEIDWLSPLRKFRKMSIFGYMFCCRREEVENSLDGFPILQPIQSTTSSNWFNEIFTGQQLKEDNKVDEESNVDLRISTTEMIQPDSNEEEKDYNYDRVEDY